MGLNTGSSKGLESQKLDPSKKPLSACQIVKMTDFLTRRAKTMGFTSILLYWTPFFDLKVLYVHSVFSPIQYIVYTLSIENTYSMTIL